MTARLPAFAGALLALALGAQAGHAAPAAAPPANVWPQTYANLPPDPAMRFGVLPNGMRYVIMHNATPKGQASFRLRFAAGSLDETDAEQGLAHLLEHMAFDGSTHVANGEMIKILERHGLAFGADTNASTSWDETVYKLDPPKADDDTLDTSLMLLREVASELTLSQDAIDRERGVVLSEERLRDTPGYRVQKAGMQLYLSDQLAARRFPIGQVAAVQNATRAQLLDIYTRYYRPERAVLIAVGDFDPDAMEAKIKARFGDWKAKAPPGPDPDLGQPAPRGAVTQLTVQPGGPQTVQMTWARPADNAPDSKAKRKEEMIGNLALAVLNRRFVRLVRSEHPPFLSASAYHGDVLHSADVTSVQTTANPGDWRGALATADTEVRRLVQYGVSADELNVEIDAYRASLKASVQGEATRGTPATADDIAETVDSPEVETSPTEDLALFEEDVRGLTPTDVDAAIKRLFSGSGPLTLVATETPVAGGDAAVAKAFAEIQAQPVAAPTAEAALSWPYASFGARGKVAERREIADLGVTFVRFANGVRLTIMPTKFKADEIIVEARIGRGRLELPSDKITPIWAASAAFPEGGLEALDTQAVDQVLHAKILKHDFTVADDAFVLSGTTRREDLGAQMQLLTAYVADPGWRPQAFQRMLTAAPSLLDQLDATPNGVLTRDLSRLMHSGDPRWGVPGREEIAAQTPTDLKSVIQPALSKGPVEVIVVGDVTPDAAIAAVGSTFGALPPREPDGPDPEEKAVFPGPVGQPIVLTHKGRADQAIGLIAWPTDDFLSDTVRARRLSVLGDVLELRLTEQLRKTESVTYSPEAGAAASTVFPHYGYMTALVEIPPAKLGGFFKDIDDITASLRTTDITADELERALKPAVDDLERRRQTNEYWMSALVGAQTDPRRIEAIRTSVAQLKSVTAEDVRRVAAAYLVDGKAWKLEVTPAPTP